MTATRGILKDMGKICKNICRPNGNRRNLPSSEDINMNLDILGLEMCFFGTKQNCSLYLKETEMLKVGTELEQLLRKWNQAEGMHSILKTEWTSLGTVLVTGHCPSARYIWQTMQYGDASQSINN